MAEADRRKGRQSGSLSSIKRDNLHDSGKGPNKELLERYSTELKSQGTHGYRAMSTPVGESHRARCICSFDMHGVLCCASLGGARRMVSGASWRASTV
jgi:hypothetical protein